MTAPYDPSLPARLGEALQRVGASSPDRDPRTRALLRFADATRRTIEEVVSTTASDDAIIEAAEHVERAARLLAGEPHGRGYDSPAESALTGDPRAFVDFSPMAGPLNPLSAPLRFEVAGDVVIGRGVFGEAFEGPPGCLHGGFVAAAFDELLGFVQALTGRPGMTGRLTVAYRSPTPLHRELRFEGRIERVDGRKMHTRGLLQAGDTLCAEAEGLFISVDPSRFATMLEQRRRS
jgi:acyl-coenzyme A thioesterase PaaI-like protein